MIRWQLHLEMAESLFGKSNIHPYDKNKTKQRTMCGIREIPQADKELLPKIYGQHPEEESKKFQEQAGCSLYTLFLVHCNELQTSKIG